MTMQNSNYGWGDFTPRAVVTLSLANKFSPIAKTDKEMIQKQLNLHMLVDLMK